ncbi:ATP-binding protein, partial [Paraburkholderia sp. Ac-20342]|uniref:ATP-binding protein n=1 Tax=Paraburkholderia sp. Ac-20342 TaxID=2703889 RepID=UPI001F11DD86
ELGYLPFSQTGGALLFHLLSKLYERTSVIITTNLSFAEWASVCSGLMKPDTDLGENARHGEVSDAEATSFVFPRVQTASRRSGA